MRRYADGRAICCESMVYRLDWHCDIHADEFDCADAIVRFNPRFQEYGLIVHDVPRSTKTPDG